VDDTRIERPWAAADERAALTGFLQYQRETLAWKCAGLTDAQLRERAVPPSTLSLLGLVWHLAKVEWSWFRYVLTGEKDSPPVWEPGGSGVFDPDAADVGATMRAWQRECARSRDIVAAAPSLDVTAEYDGELFSLRSILTHMIEEYARHNGHADLIRERLDGTTGE
jgi:uncharacterized damage-inducible protein DinB